MKTEIRKLENEGCFSIRTTSCTLEGFFSVATSFGPFHSRTNYLVKRTIKKHKAKILAMKEEEKLKETK